MATQQELKTWVRNVPDFPKPGIVFRDITTVLGEPARLRTVVQAMWEPFSNQGVSAIVAVEARGFIFGSTMAYLGSCSFVPVRKPGKLPCATLKQEYALEYGTDAIEVHADAIRPGERVLIVDDLLATGGTAVATMRLIEKLGGQVVGLSFFIELGFLKGRDALSGYRVHSLLQYDSE
jgi:adenine phosphoribosyltransferase